MDVNMVTKNFRLRVLAIVIVSGLVISACNLFDADQGSSNREPPPPPEYAALTSPGNLVHNLVLSYAYLDIEEYASLLLSTEDGDYGREYRWYFQSEDAAEIGSDYWTRLKDIEVTNNLFRAASGTPVNPFHTKLEDLFLDIMMYTPWFTIDSLWGEPCEDCWSIVVPYDIRIDFDGDRIYGDDLVEFFIVPIDEGDVTTYRIASMRDVHDE